MEVVAEGGIVIVRTEIEKKEAFVKRRVSLDGKKEKNITDLIWKEIFS